MVWDTVAFHKQFYLKSLALQGILGSFLLYGYFTLKFTSIRDFKDVIKYINNMSKKPYTSEEKFWLVWDCFHVSFL